MAEAVLAIDDKQWDKALDLLRQALARAPGHVEALYYTGVAYLGKRQPTAAVPPLTQAYQAAPNDPSIAYQLGLAYFALEQYDRAEPLLESVFARDPTLPSLGYYVGLPPLSQGQVRGSAPGVPGQPDVGSRHRGPDADLRRPVAPEARAGEPGRGRDRPARQAPSRAADHRPGRARAEQPRTGPRHGPPVPRRGAVRWVLRRQRAGGAQRDGGQRPGRRGRGEAQHLRRAALGAAGLRLAARRRLDRHRRVLLLRHPQQLAAGLRPAGLLRVAQHRATGAGRSTCRCWPA